MLTTGFQCKTYRFSCAPKNSGRKSTFWLGHCIYRVFGHARTTTKTASIQLTHISTLSRSHQDWCTGTVGWPALVDRAKFEHIIIPSYDDIDITRDQEGKRAESMGNGNNSNSSFSLILIGYKVEKTRDFLILLWKEPARPPARSTPLLIGGSLLRCQETSQGTAISRHGS